MYPSTFSGFMIFAVLLASACKGPPKSEKSVTASESLSMYFVDEAKSFCLTTVAPKVPFSQSDIDRAKAKAGRCPNSLTVNGKNLTRILDCDAYQDKDNLDIDPNTYQWSIYNGGPDSSGAIRNISIEDAKEICANLAP